MTNYLFYLFLLNPTRIVVRVWCMRMSVRNLTINLNEAVLSKILSFSSRKFYKFFKQLER